jgi:Na+-transporting methylmalonyl-CoA/oxaloacetate decarboxylase gamma subunit
VPRVRRPAGEQGASVVGVVGVGFVYLFIVCFIYHLLFIYFMYCFVASTRLLSSKPPKTSAWSARS